MIGLTSITFRQMNIEDIVNIAASAKLDCIEWGGDIHVPVGNVAIARYASELTRSAHLKVLSYGSYYRLCQGQDFSQVLKTAYELGAPNIRIWAGSISPKDASEIVYLQAAKELSSICSLAKEYGITVSMEYHRGTLTETAASALELIKLTSNENLRCYWQLNPEISHARNYEDLLLIRPYLSHIHTFQWDANNNRCLLADGHSNWIDYIRGANMDLAKSAYLIEFVKDDSIENFMEDIVELKKCLAIS